METARALNEPPNEEPADGLRPNMLLDNEAGDPTQTIEKTRKDAVTKANDKTRCTLKHEHNMQQTPVEEARIAE
uniref:Uncharacterized protein n=1 Tax=Heterorhabditis bacteriophora TaxID=37862 RepID=A0A1I7WPN2_HETBA